MTVHKAINLSHWAAFSFVLVWVVFWLAANFSAGVGDRFTATDAAAQKTVMQTQIDVLKSEMQDLIGGER